jgi:hypothetical protein
MTIVASTTLFAQENLLTALQQTPEAAPAAVQPAAPATQAPAIAVEYKSGAECTAWVVQGDFKWDTSILALSKQLEKTAHNKYFIDSKDALAVANVPDVAAKQMLICWEGAVNVERAGNYTLMAKSPQDGFYGCAGCLVELNGKKEIEYNAANSQDAAQGSSIVTLKAGWNKIKIWAHANTAKQQVVIAYQRQKSPTEIPIKPENMYYEHDEEQ